MKLLIPFLDISTGMLNKKSVFEPRIPWFYITYSFFIYII